MLSLVAEGLTNAQIADRLGVSPRTVIAQIDSASPRFGATGRNHAAALIRSPERAGRPDRRGRAVTVSTGTTQLFTIAEGTAIAGLRVAVERARLRGRRDHRRLGGGRARRRLPGNRDGRVVGQGRTGRSTVRSGPAGRGAAPSKWSTGCATTCAGWAG